MAVAVEAQSSPAGQKLLEGQHPLMLILLDLEVCLYRIFDGPVDTLSPPPLALLHPRSALRAGFFVQVLQWHTEETRLDR